MRIGLDARSIFTPRPRGTGRNLRDAFALVPSVRPDWNFILYHQRRVPKPTADLSDNQPLSNPNVRARRIECPGDRFGAWFHVRLPLAAWADDVDLLHLPSNAAPLAGSVPTVVTVHDLIPLTVAGECSMAQKKRFRRDITRAVRRAVHIITPSAATRDALGAQFDVAPDRVTVIPWAADRGVVDALSSAGDAQAAIHLQNLREKYRLDGRWLLNFSGASYRKNAQRLIEAFGRLDPELRSSLLLVLVGCEPSEFRAKLRRFATQAGVEAQCRFLGFVPHVELPWLLQGAEAMLMPSLEEGFGLPILDAFAAGTAVLTSKCSSMPEVAGTAAEYCDPRDTADMTRGIAQVLRRDRAAELIRRGSERLLSYSWEATARAMCEVYAHCLDQVASGGVRTHARSELLEVSRSGG